MWRQIIAFREKREVSCGGKVSREEIFHQFQPVFRKNDWWGTSWRVSNDSQFCYTRVVAKSWYIFHHEGFFSKVWRRARVLFERAIKSYFVDTLRENQICHPIPAAVPLKIRFRDFNLFIRTSKAGFIFYSVLKKNSYFCNLTSSACRSILKATSSLIMIADISVS